MVIETRRLFLREMTYNDFDDLYEILADSDIMKHYPYSFDENRVKRWIERNIERYKVFSFGLWAVVLKETNEVIGDCGLTMQAINGVIKPEIGYHIKRKHQRNGYAKEAAKACISWSFENTPFNALYSYMLKENTPSSLTAMSAGMTFDEEYSESGKNICVYTISRGDWENG